MHETKEDNPWKFLGIKRLISHVENIKKIYENLSDKDETITIE